MAERDTYLNALVGAVVSIVFAFLPLSPAVGGGVAGYLEGPDTDDGLRVGVLSGLFILVPVLFVALLFGGAMVAVVPMMGHRSPLAGTLGLFVLLLAVLFVGLYAVGLSAIGGVLGSYLKREL